MAETMPHRPPSEAAEVTADDEKQLSSFHRVGEFLSILHELLSSSSSSSPAPSTNHLDRLQSQLRTILDEYQEQPYLLDPHLSALITPPVEILQSAIRQRDATSPAVARSAALLYSYTKVRGYKTIIRYLPHQVSDMLPVVDALESAQASASDRSQGWELRYVLLLWLSLVCMIPFPLDKFASSEDVTDRITAVCLSFLDSPGKERDAATVALGKLLQRRDVYETRLPWFIAWATERIRPPAQPSSFLATGVLQVLCELLKAAPANIVVPLLPQIQVILSLGDHGEEEDDSPTLLALRGNSLVNRYRCKLAARMGMTLLSVPHTDVPEQIDAYIAQLLSGLEDKDTIVRYSAAKGLARICQRLPEEFTAQVGDAITALFEINVLRLKDGTPDLSAVSEHTWQGACMGLAELGRRRLLAAAELEEKLEWVLRALFFDVRRGSHSIGTAVRDAACYVLWGIARASYPAEVLRPHAEGIAKALVTVSCLDRDISIRRAASAAFQEGVGRLGLYPHGIDVIGKTDFFSVGIRRTAFLRCCASVAVHSEYRLALLDHLLNTTVVHWDPAMREMGAKAVASVATLDVDGLAPRIIAQMSKHAKSRDSNVLHGSLLTLAELGTLCSDNHALRSRIFSTLSLVLRNAIGDKPSVLIAACKLIASSCIAEPEDEVGWRAFLDLAMARREEAVHDAAAEGWEAMSRVRDCDEFMAGLIADVSWKKLPQHKQQSAVRVLGGMQYRDQAKVKRLREFLLKVVGTSRHVETKRNAAQALVAVCGGEQLDEVWAALTRCLDDYTTDQRGDVGSWVRLAALRGLRELSQRGKVPSEVVFHAAVAAVGKQTMERIDHLRAEAALTLLTFYAGLPAPHGSELIRSNFSDVLPALGEEQTFATLKDPAYLFPRSVRALLSIEAYRHQALRGLVQALGTKTQMSQRVVAKSLLDYVKRGEGYSPLALLSDLVTWAEQDWGKSSVCIAVFATLSTLLDDDDVVLAIGSEARPELERILALCTRSIGKVTSPARLNITGALNASLLGAACLLEDSDLALRSLTAFTTYFLAHEKYPTVRAAAAEKLYQVVASRWPRSDEEGEEESEVERAEELLLGREWSSSDSDLREGADEVRDLLARSLGGGAKA